MKKALSISFAALLLTGSAQAEQLAAWTFSNLTSPLSTSYQNNYGSQTASFNLTGEGTSNNLVVNNPNNLNYSDVVYKGNYTSPNLDPNNRFNSELFPNDQDGYLGFRQYRTNYDPLRSAANGKTFSIELDSQDPTLGYGDLSFTYAAGASQNASNSAGDFAITWKVSFDGGEFITLGTDTFTAGAANVAEYGHLISGSGSSVVITGTLSLAVPQSGASFNQLWFDTFILNGEQMQVPEPSTYALILGALGLGFVVIRRRAAKRA